ncbi:MAG: hypothetical protein ACYSU0_12885 [Planctomycetota bacterium]|jgi:hypothetical protein
MPTVLYAGDDFPQRSVLVEDSLYETIYRLEEAYWGLRDLSKKEAKRTFKWIQSRIDYGREDVLVRTEYDRLRTGGYRDRKTGKYVRTTYLKSLTGEPGWKRSFVLLCSVLRTPELVPDLTDGLTRNFMTNDPGPKGRREGVGSEGILESGMYCCQVCTPQYERALRRAAPGLYRRQEAKFMSHLKAWRERGGGTRWYRAPFYVTVLALHDIGSRSAKEELKRVARRVKPNIADKWTGEGRASRAKAKAAEILLTYR